MNGALFLCDDARAPREWRDKWPKTVVLNTTSRQAPLNFTLGDLEETFRGGLQGRALDLIRIATFALAADQSVSRGGNADPRLRAWHRRLGLVVPVDHPDFWSETNVLKALRACLGFLSDDDWDFRFVPWAEQPERQPALSDDVPAPDAETEVVIPFSGGIDSLTAVVEELRAGRRPLLISHSSSNVLESHRRKIVEGLRALFSDRTIGGRVSVKANRTHSRVVEDSNRSRAFFFASLAMVAAIRRRTSNVLLPDNGWASVNPRINDQLVGALATRSTHPRFLRLFNELSQFVFDDAPHIRNPFWDQTRADVLARLRDAGGTPLLGNTRSCAAGRNLRREKPHCGRCSQCIDRRFAIEATGLTEHDPPEGYNLDIFADNLIAPAKVLALSYARVARKIDGLSEDGIFEEFPELIECLGPTDAENEAHQYIKMFQRQASFVLRVIEDQLEAALPGIARGELEAESLIGRLAAEQSRVGEQSAEFTHSADYASVTWRGEDFALTRSQAAVIRNLHQAYEKGTGVLGRALALEGSGREYARMSDIFKRHPAWQTLVVGVGKSAYKLDLSPNVARNSPPVA